MATRLAGAIDTHTHLNHPRLLRRLDEVLARAHECGVTEMIVVGYDLPSSETALKLAETHPGLWATVGVHPHDASTLDEQAMAGLRKLARSQRVVAIGETGLDFYRDLSPREVQLAAFRRQLALAEELGRPVVVHCRGAQEALLEVLSGYAKLGPRTIWHCFDGTREQADQALDLGAALGFTGTITYRGAEALRRIAAGIPTARLLLETDAPYLSPEPRRSADNEPGNLLMIAQRLAEVRGTKRDELICLAADNARRVFGLRDEGRNG